MMSDVVAGLDLHVELSWQRINRNERSLTACSSRTADHLTDEDVAD
jgi:hypothetical protein